MTKHGQFEHGSSQEAKMTDEIRNDIERILNGMPSYPGGNKMIRRVRAALGIRTARGRLPLPDYTLPPLIFPAPR
jgi:hypothetical protein